MRLRRVGGGSHPAFFRHVPAGHIATQAQLARNPQRSRREHRNGRFQRPNNGAASRKTPAAHARPSSLL